MVFRHVDGKTFTEDDMRANIERIVPLVACAIATSAVF